MAMNQAIRIVAPKEATIAMLLERLSEAWRVYGVE